MSERIQDPVVHLENIRNQIKKGRQLLLYINSEAAFSNYDDRFRKAVVEAEIWSRETIELGLFRPFFRYKDHIYHGGLTDHHRPSENWAFYHNEVHASVTSLENSIKPFEKAIQSYTDA